MPRKVVPLVTGEIYHVYNRGVDKRNIFISKKDYIRFYQCLHYFNVLEPIRSLRHAQSLCDDNCHRLVSIYAYSLLPNHFHLLIEQKTDGGLSEFMKRVSGGYTSYFNEQNDRTGALFQGNYKRVHVRDDAQFRYLLAYVNENHFVHKLPREDDVVYTSSVHYQGKSKSKVIVNDLKFTYKEARSLASEINKKRKETNYLLE